MCEKYLGRLGGFFTLLVVLLVEIIFSLVSIVDGELRDENCAEKFLSDCN